MEKLVGNLLKSVLLASTGFQVGGQALEARRAVGGQWSNSRAIEQNRGQSFFSSGFSTKITLTPLLRAGVRSWCRFCFCCELIFTRTTVHAERRNAAQYRRPDTYLETMACWAKEFSGAADFGPRKRGQSNFRR
jgi:hypothetical protein